jgi:hypothetical protein
MPSLGQTAYQLSFQISPIIYTGGVAQFIPGGMLPVVALTQSLDFVSGLLSGGSEDDLANFFAHFKPQSGAKLNSNQYGMYPFANQSVAANATISEPLVLSMLMTLNVKSVATRLATMSALKKMNDLHTNMGGTFTVATPSYIYTNCLLKDLTCVGETGKMVQNVWQWDFLQPLLTQEAAQLAYNGMMMNVANAVPSTGALSGLEVVGSPLSLAAPSVMPSALNLAGAGAASFSPI